MSANRFDPKTTIVAAFIILTAAARVLFSLPLHHSPLGDFSPIGAMALFGGAYFSGKSKAFLFPLLTLWASDIFLNRFVYYGEWRLLYENFYWTYGAFALMVLTGRTLLKKVNVQNLLLAALVVVLIHWVLTDFGVWLEGTMYPKTMGGFGACLVAAIPFEKYVLGGTLLYSGVLFGLFEWVKPRLAIHY